MKNLVVIKSCYKDYIDYLSLPNIFYKPSKKEEYINTVNYDIKRISLFQTKNHIKAHQDKLSKLPQEKPYSYSQGDFDARSLTALTLGMSKWIVEKKRTGNEFHDNFLDYGASYLDENGKLNGFAISCLKWKKKIYICFAIIKNVKLPPMQREVIIISQPVILNQKKSEAVQRFNISINKLSRVIRDNLESKSLYHYLEPIFDSPLSSNAYNYLRNINNCFKPNTPTDINKANQLRTEFFKPNPITSFAIKHPYLTSGLIGLSIALFAVVLTLVGPLSGFCAAIGSAIIGKSGLSALIAGTILSSSSLGLFSSGLTLGATKSHKPIDTEIKYPNYPTDNLSH